MLQDFWMWLGRVAANDDQRVNAGTVDYVTDAGDGDMVGCWLLQAGVPAGWLRLHAGAPADEVVRHAWADGFLRVDSVDLDLLAGFAGVTQVMADCFVPWGVVAWHVLRSPAGARYCRRIGLL